MNKFTISIIIFVLVYLGIGTIYSHRASYCEERKDATNSENSGSNLIGRTITTVFWPLFITDDKINHVGIFDCK
jgi:hypothetical protein